MSRHDDPNHFDPPQDYGYAAAYRVPASQAVPQERMAFIRRTYAHVAGAVAAFVLLTTLLFQTPIPYLVTRFAAGASWLIVLGIFMVVTWGADYFARQVTSRPLQYAGLGLGVLAYSFIFMPLLVAAVHHTNAAVLPQAALTTTLVFGGLTAVVFVTKQDFSFLRIGISIGGLLAMGAIVVGSLFGFNLGLGFSIFMVGFASSCVLYYTSKTLHDYDTTQHVPAALSIFMSVMLLFWYVLQIFMSRR